jgi:hypothetical protein
MTAAVMMLSRCSSCIPIPPRGILASEELDADGAVEN